MTSAFHQRRRKHPRSMTSARGRIKEYFILNTFRFIDFRIGGGVKDYL